MKMKLFHGRKDPTENLENWGFDGDVIEGIKYIHGTYLTHITIGFNTWQECELASAQTGWEKFEDKVLEVNLTDDLIRTKEGYFGDFEIVG